jgi:AraC-like DNA-binding protein
VARIGLLGGTFNPPHLAHLVCAQEALVALGLDRVLLVPVAVAPHKTIDAEPGVAHRLAMCEAAVAGDERLGVSRADAERSGPAYTVDLLRALREQAALPLALERALELMVAGGGRLDAGALAREVGWSRRRLAELVRREVGLPPRQLARVIRLQRCSRLLATGSWETLGELAAAAGYFDHAHMLHEWSDLVGCRPTQWLGEEVPSVQDRLRRASAE